VRRGRTIIDNYGTRKERGKDVDFGGDAPKYSTIGMASEYPKVGFRVIEPGILDLTWLAKSQNLELRAAYQLSHTPKMLQTLMILLNSSLQLITID
jgi:hypothetical protein